MNCNLAYEKKKKKEKINCFFIGPSCKIMALKTVYMDNKQGWVSVAPVLS